MSEEPDFQKLKQTYLEFFSLLPQELVNFVFSDETFNKIADICGENGVQREEIIEKIAERIGLVLLQQVPEENFVTMLETGVGLDNKKAQKIYLEAKRLIFSQAPGAGPKKKVGQKKPPLTVGETLFGAGVNKPELNK